MDKLVFKGIVGILFGLIISVIITNIIRSEIKIVELENDIREKEKYKAKLEREVAEYNEKINKIDTSFSRERDARNSLQMVLPGEKIYRFIEVEND